MNRTVYGGRAVGRAVLMAGRRCPAEYLLSTPGVPQIVDEHYPDHPDGRSIHQP
ncbi:hypothetical protein ACFWGI_39105 [Streptomyces niveus]|uniref:hypothetical protein n=1 Tax=Streptomyces niveus TaxID=193462 RepID=UPI003669F0D1